MEDTWKKYENQGISTRVTPPPFESIWANHKGGDPWIWPRLWIPKWAFPLKEREFGGPKTQKISPAAGRDSPPSWPDPEIDKGGGGWPLSIYPDLTEMLMNTSLKLEFGARSAPRNFLGIFRCFQAGNALKLVQKWYFRRLQNLTEMLMNTSKIWKSHRNVNEHLKDLKISQKY